jgi:hypothetical protein
VTHAYDDACTIGIVAVLIDDANLLTLLHISSLSAVSGWEGERVPTLE